MAPGDARWCGTCGAALRPEAAPPSSDDGVDIDREGRGGRVAAAGVLTLVLVGLLVGQATTEAPVVPAGFTSRGDGARTGIVSTTTVPAPTGIAWRTDVDLPPLLTPGADVLGTTTTTAGQELVVVLDPSPDGQRITTHDATTGQLQASRMLPLGSQPYSQTMAAGLLAHRDLTSVTLLDLTTGAVRWRIETRLREATQLIPAGVVGVTADAVGPVLTLFAAEDGAVSWQRQLAPSGQVTEILWAEGSLVVVVDDGDAEFVSGLDPADGSERWRLQDEDLQPPRQFPLAPTIAEDGLVVVAVGDGVLLVDAEDGSVDRIADDAVTGPAVVTAVGDGLVLRSDGLFTIVAYSTLSGERLWAVPAPRNPILSLSISGDVIAVRGDDATALLDAATGEITTRIGPAGGTSRLVTTTDGAIARVTADGDVELVGRDGVQWRVPTIAVHLPDLATNDGGVALTTPAGVQVHDVTDGNRRFTHEAFDSRLVIAGTLLPPSLVAGRVFIAPALTQPADRGGLLSLFADTGIVDWARTDDRVVPRGTPVVDRDLVVLPVGSQLLGFDRVTGRRALVVETTIARTDLAAADGWLVATDAPRDGGDLWVGRRVTRDLVFRAPIRTCAPPVIHDDLAIVVNHLGDIVARRLEDGEQPWGERARGSACRPLSIAGDVLIALVDDRELLAVTLDDGDTAWRLELPAHAAGAPVVAGDQVLVPTIAGQVLAYTVTGTTAPEGPAWQVDVDGTPAGAVAVDGDTVLVLTRQGELVALR